VVPFFMAAIQTLWSEKKRRMVQATRNLVKKEEMADPQVQVFTKRWEEMANDLNSLGCGIFDALKDQKRSYDTNHELSVLIDALYNSTNRAHHWPELNSAPQLQLHGAAARLRATWGEAHKTVRPAAASVAVDRALAQIRNFANVSYPQMKAQMNDLRVASLDLGSYSRRTNAMLQTRDRGGSKLAPLEQKLANAKGRYESLNAALKDDLVKEKIMRDRLLEDAVATILIVQYEMHYELAKNLGDIVSTLPQEKVLAIRKQISDTIAVGGPASLSTGEVSSARKVMEMATGLRTASDYVKEEAEKKKTNAERARAGEALARTEDEILGRTQPQSTPPSPPPPPPPPATAAGETFRAIFDCEAEVEGDLSFHVGELVQVTRKDESGWWEGRIANRTGQFPANYVEKQVRARAQEHCSHLTRP
jgi:hypothetical protein